MFPFIYLPYWFKSSTLPSSSSLFLIGISCQAFTRSNKHTLFPRRKVSYVIKPPLFPAPVPSVSILAYSVPFNAKKSWLYTNSSKKSCLQVPSPRANDPFYDHLHEIRDCVNNLTLHIKTVISDFNAHDIPVYQTELTCRGHHVRLFFSCNAANARHWR